MSRKHNYIIRINKPHKPDMSLQYSYGGTKDISFKISKNSALFTFNMTVKKAPDDFIITKNQLLRDAIKKFYLIHTIMYNGCPDLKTIEITTDNANQIYKSGDDGFPKIFTLIPKKIVSLPESWKTHDFLSYLAGINKTKGEKEPCFSGVESFLAAQGRIFEIDRFTNLWTAMNAFYYDVALHCREHLENAAGLTEKLPDIAGNDSASINLLMRLIKQNSDAQKLNTSDQDSELYHKVAKALIDTDDENISGLYRDTLGQAQCGKPDKNTLGKKYPLYKDIISGNSLNLDLFFILLFWFPYLCRCSFIHGRKPTILTAFADEYEVQYLHKINLFLQCFLIDYLPNKMFYENYDDKLLAKCYLSCLQKGDGKKKATAALKNLTDGTNKTN